MSKVLIALCIPVILLTCIRWLPGSEKRAPHELIAPAENTRTDAFLRHQQCQVHHWRDLMIQQ